VYPFDLKVSGLEGRANVEFVIDREGHVRDLRVLDCTHPLFGLAAEAAVNQWRFAPGKKAGRLVTTRIQQSLVFNIGEEPSKPTTPRAPPANIPSSSP
jgi:TonB family protein